MQSNIASGAVSHGIVQVNISFAELERVVQCYYAEGIRRCNLIFTLLDTISASKNEKKLSIVESRTSSMAITNAQYQYMPFDTFEASIQLLMLKNPQTAVYRFLWSGRPSTSNLSSTTFVRHMTPYVLTPEDVEQCKRNSLPEEWKESTSSTLNTVSNFFYSYWQGSPDMNVHAIISISNHKHETMDISVVRNT
ncbi:hypothetical protein N9E76_01130, partial [bacterium]|nr:hypothetical protein [bacterium]